MSARWEISKEQAAEIAMKHLAEAGQGVGRMLAVYEGSTEDVIDSEGRYDADYTRSPSCWILVFRDESLFGPEPHAPQRIVWVDQRTGNVVRLGFGRSG